jgi:hypothetical protein
MTLETFYSRHEFLYHLTSAENADEIIEARRLSSTKKILANSTFSQEEKTKYLTERRPVHLQVDGIDGSVVMVRDQRPISEKALAKTLTDDWTVGQFIESLNSRIFFWPNLKRLAIHYKRYQSENPRIIRVRSKAMVEKNTHNLRFCHLNSGATRCHPKWKAPPPRGANTFVRVDEWPYPVAAVAEVTFENECALPDQLWISDSPDGPWTEVNL